MGIRTPDLLHAMRIRSVDLRRRESNGEPLTCSNCLTGSRGVRSCLNTVAPVSGSPALSGRDRGTHGKFGARLIQAAGQVGLVRRALMGAQRPPPGQRGDPVHFGQQLAGTLTAGTGGPLAAPVVGVAEPLQPALALPGVGDDPRTGLDVTGYEGVQRGAGCIGQQRHPAPASAP